MNKPKRLVTYERAAGTPWNPTVAVHWVEQDYVLDLERRIKDLERRNQYLELQLAEAKAVVVNHEGE